MLKNTSRKPSKALKSQHKSARSIITKPKRSTRSNSTHKSKLVSQPKHTLSSFSLQPDPNHVATEGPESTAVLSVMRQLLRNTNPRVQGMKPRRSIRKSNGYNAIVNEYRVHQNCTFLDAWKFHSTASEVLTSYKANTNNANTLYQSGWKPSRSQKQQVESVARRIGVGIDIDPSLDPQHVNLEEMLLFSNTNTIRIDPQTDRQQILGDDSKFLDIFGSIDDTASSIPGLQNAFGAGNKNLQQQGIGDDLQSKLFADLGFDVGATIDTHVESVKYKEITDVQGFPVRIPITKRKLGANGWEVEGLTSSFIAPKSPSLNDTNTNSTWDSAFSYANSALSFSRHLTIRVLNATQHNENVNAFGLLGNLLNGTENISTPAVFPAMYTGVTPNLAGRTVM